MVKEEKKKKKKEAYIAPKVLATYQKEDLEKIIKPHGGYSNLNFGGGGCGCGCGCGCSGV